MSMLYNTTLNCIILYLKEGDVSIPKMEVSIDVRHRIALRYYYDAIGSKRSRSFLFSGSMAIGLWAQSWYNHTRHHRSLNIVEVMPQFHFKFTKWLYNL